MQIKCDKCSAVSDSITPETYLEGDIEFTFFRCPACGEVYPVCNGLSAPGGHCGIYQDAKSDPDEAGEGILHPQGRSP